MENNRDIVVGLGEILWDVLPEGRQLGGAPANFAYHVSQLGLRSCVISAVGDDNLGNEIIDILERKSVNMIMPKVSYPTGTVQVSLDDKGIPTYEIKENVAWDNIPYSERLDNLSSRTAAVCFGSLAQRSEISRNTISRFIDNLPDDEVIKVFDINLRQNYYSKELIESSLNRCNMLKINDEELSVVSDMFGLDKRDYKEQCLYLIGKYSLNSVILTCGEVGSYVFTDRTSSFLRTPIVEVKDTVGAGDSFTGAFIAALLKGKNLEDAHKLAVEVSAYVCKYNGAMPEYSSGLRNILK